MGQHIDPPLTKPTFPHALLSRWKILYSILHSIFMKIFPIPHLKKIIEILKTKLKKKTYSSFLILIAVFIDFPVTLIYGYGV